MSDVELAQLKPAAPVSKKNTSRIVVALAAAVAASAATAYAVQHKNRSGDSQVSLQRRLDLIMNPEELGDSIHEDSWTCVPQESDCDLFSNSCLRIDSESCAKKYFGEGANAKYGSEVDCLAQDGVNGFVTQWCPEKPLLAGCNSANRCIFRKEANGKIISKPKGKDNGACTFDCPTYTELRDDAMTVISSPPPSPAQLAVQVSCSPPFYPDGICGTYLAGDDLDTPLFTKDGDPKWRIRNTGCGWTVENYDELLSEPDWASRATTQCPECTDSCSTVEALTTDETNESGVSLALGHYDGETFTPSVPPSPPPQLAVEVTVSCSDDTLCINGMAGTYLAGDELDELHGTPLFTKNGDPKWRIRNTGCGWKVEEEFPFDWSPRAITYKDYYKEECWACTGSCRTVDALTTDEVYYDDGVADGNLWPEVSLALGSYDGEFVAA